MHSLLLAAILFAAKPAVNVSVDVQPNEVLSGIRDIKVTVAPVSGLVQQVEFYLNGDLRDSVSGYPYMFKLNTYDVDDGNAKLEFQVQTTLGEKGQTSVNVKIDNGVSKGVDFHVQRGLAFLSDSKFGQAEISGRLAMKAAQRLQDGGGSFDEKKDMNPARIVLARAYLGLGRYDRAQKFAEDALSADADNPALLELATGVGLKRALEMMDRSGDSTEAVDSMRDALSTAIGRKKKSLEAKLDAAGSPTLDNALKYSDLAIAAGRYSLAINALDMLVIQNPSQTEVVNRLAFAAIRSNRYAKASDVLSTLRKRGRPNAYSYAMTAILAAENGDKAGQEEAIKETALNGGEGQGVQTAEAYLALRDGKLATFADMLKTMQGSYPDSAETSVLLSFLLTAQGKPEESHAAFEDAVMRNPLLIDSYLLEARTSLLLASKGGQAGRQKFFYRIAKMYYEVALSARPESVEALTGLGITSLALGDKEHAKQYVKAATMSVKDYTAAHYAIAFLYHLERLSASNQPTETGQSPATMASENFLAEMKTCARLDPKNLGGVASPTLDKMLRYFARYGASPIIAAP